MTAIIAILQKIDKMVASNNNDNEALVWIWLPNETMPVVAGRLETDARAIFERQRCIIDKN